MSVLARPHVRDLAPVHHGSISDHELDLLGLRREQIVDFSVNSNPLGPSPAAVEAAQKAIWTHYPDDRASALRRAIAEREGLTEAEVVVANGSAELIWLLALAFLSPGDAAVIVGPTFGEYARAVRIAGATPFEWRARAEERFAIDSSEVRRLVDQSRARVLFVCDPNNPTGVRVERGPLARSDALLVIDEAYLPFAEDRGSTGGENVVRLRSLTKDGAMPGLRLGYALAPAPMAAALDAVRPPWSVNAVAQAAGLATLGDDAHMERAREEVRRARAYLVDSLGALPSAANYVLLEVEDAAATRSALLRKGMVVRDCTSFGLPGHVRIGVRTLAECRLLVEAYRSL